jgi:hypothetical protein
LIFPERKAVDGQQYCVLFDWTPDIPWQSARLSEFPTANLAEVGVEPRRFPQKMEMLRQYALPTLCKPRL